MGESDDYREFLERYIEDEETSIPDGTSDWARRRCLFFLKMLESSRDLAAADEPEEEPLPAAGPTQRIDISEVLAEAGQLTAPGAPGEAPETTPAGEGSDRYVIERELAQGGMGRILLAYDRDFRRRIAMKVLRGSHAGSRGASRFIAEAQATAQLEHPNIAPIYDLGKDASGLPFFTMKWIRGRNLEEIIAAGGPEFSLIRLVQILQQVAMGVHFAHSRGVVHRDLKPQNIMVGDFGEVLVVDWGLAKVLDRGPAKGDGAEMPVSTRSAFGGERTIEGAVQGSPVYMAPEQARGQVSEIDARTDVFGLGAILYEILTGQPLHAGRQGESLNVVLERARRGDFVPPRERAPARPIPLLLESVCRKALAARKEDRYQSARELADALQAYVEGIHDAERRAAEARRLLASAGELEDTLRRTREREAALRREEADLRERLAEHAGAEAKQPLWELTARVEDLRQEEAAAFNRATAAFMAVLSIDPEQPAARNALAGIYFERFQEAQERGDGESAALYEGLVSQYDDGRRRLQIEGQGLLRLETEPAGAAVFLSRYEERGPLLVEGPPAALGITPIERPLPRGSYLAVLRKEGREEARYPFVILPAAEHDAVVRLPAAGEVASGFVFIPGGETLAGGDDRLHDALPRARARIADLCAGRFPVTLGEYCEFLSDEFREPRPDLREHLPAFGTEQYVERGPDGLFHPLPRLGPLLPAIALLPVPATTAYCAWLSRRLGKPVRLLQELEWERCARGADGRAYPWGNGFDWALTKGGLSRPGEPGPEPVGAFPHDVSPFGVRDLAGGVRELCAGWYRPEYRPLRGGSWIITTPLVFRADFRTSRREGTRTTDAGFRVGY
jgi:serine/threonine-protein kinase